MPLAVVKEQPEYVATPLVNAVGDVVQENPPLEVRLTVVVESVVRVLEFVSCSAATTVKVAPAAMEAWGDVV